MSSPSSVTVETPGVLVEFYVRQSRGSTQYMLRSLARVFLPPEDVGDFASVKAAAPRPLPLAVAAAAGAGLPTADAVARGALEVAVEILERSRRDVMKQQIRNGDDAWLRRSAAPDDDLALPLLQCSVCEAAIFDAHYCCWKHRQQCTICVKCWTDHHWGAIPSGGHSLERRRGASLRDASSAAAHAAASELSRQLSLSEQHGAGEEDGGDLADRASSSGDGLGGGGAGAGPATEVVHRQQHFAFSRRWTNSELETLIAALNTALRVAPRGGDAASAAVAAAEVGDKRGAVFALGGNPAAQRKRPSASSSVSASAYGSAAAAAAAAAGAAPLLPPQIESMFASSNRTRTTRLASVQPPQFQPLCLPFSFAPQTGETVYVEGSESHLAGRVTGSSILAGTTELFSSLDSRELHTHNTTSKERNSTLGVVLRAVFNSTLDEVPKLKVLVGAQLPPVDARLAAEMSPAERYVRRIIAPPVLRSVPWLRATAMEDFVPSAGARDRAGIASSAGSSVPPLAMGSAAAAAEAEAEAEAAPLPSSLDPGTLEQHPLHLLIAPASMAGDPGPLPLHIAPLSATYSLICAKNSLKRDVMPSATAAAGKANGSMMPSAPPPLSHPHSSPPVAEWTVYHPKDRAAVVELLFERMVQIDVSGKYRKFENASSVQSGGSGSGSGSGGDAGSGHHGGERAAGSGGDGGSASTSRRLDGIDSRRAHAELDHLDRDLDLDLELSKSSRSPSICSSSANPLRLPHVESSAITAAHHRSSVDMWRSIDAILDGIFLTDEAVQHILRAKGVQCWRFQQRVGEVVVIPSGCVVQCRFYADCVFGRRELLVREHTQNFVSAAADLRFSTTAPPCVSYADVLAWDLLQQTLVPSRLRRLGRRGQSSAAAAAAAVAAAKEEERGEDGVGGGLRALNAVAFH